MVKSTAGGFESEDPVSSWSVDLGVGPLVG